jgi:hypothetical protein
MKVPCRRNCDIPDGGLCPRHNCQKTKSWAALCRRYDAYFAAWEDGRGPGQRSVAVDGPSIAERAWNLTEALFAFVQQPGFVDAQTHHTRRGLCDKCEKRDGNWCTVCGCYLPVKVTARAWECPEKKWLAIEKPSPCGGCGRRKTTA